MVNGNRESAHISETTRTTEATSTPAPLVNEEAAVGAVVL